jgi:hypothetical protein
MNSVGGDPHSKRITMDALFWQEKLEQLAEIRRTVPVASTVEKVEHPAHKAGPEVISRKSV